MNERIQALVEQADRWARIMTWSDDPRYGDKPVSDLFNQKFAELIVREMTDVFDQRAKPGTGFYEPHEPAELIREHFGVEE
jgi:hypothetical protein